MLGPGNDSGTTALIDPEYDALMSRIVDQPLMSIAVLAVETPGGRRGVYSWMFGAVNARTADASVSARGEVRLMPVMAGVRGATAAAERDGLECA